MDFQSLALICLALIAGTSADLPRIQNFAFQVLLKFNEVPFCGGSIITERHVLTAAHCVAGKSKDFGKIGIFAGTTYSNEREDPVYSIYRVDIEPKYTGKLTKSFIYMYDIAIVTLKETIIFSNVRNKIRLPTEEVRVGSKATLSGWGITTYTQKGFSTDMLSHDFTIINLNKCGAILSNRIQPDQICSFSKNPVKKCPGDSGGPLVIDGKLVGIASNTIICQKNVPDLYTSVYHSMPFIRKILGNQ